jgi:hypothetical protein
MKFDSKTYEMVDSGRFGSIALIVGIVGLVLSLVGFFVDSTQFFHAWLVAFAYWTTIALGGLFFTMLHNLTNANWSVVLRRVSESVMSVLPWMAIFVIPILLGIHELFHWSHAEVMATDEALHAKAGYLNVPFYVIRTVAYFLIWFLLVRALNRTSLKQDGGGDFDYRYKLRKISAPGMLLFAVTATFASYDWLMSLDAHWYSTIFGPYIYSGSFLAALAFLIIACLFLRHKGVLAEEITVEHYHDLGKLTFAFIIFWGYMAFSQYFLIWYANIPEETVWFLDRWEGDWKTVSLVIVFGHFFFPFAGLITRAAKRSVPWLWFMGIWILVAHWVDLYWVVYPAVSKTEAVFSWMDVTCLAGIGGIAVWIMWRRFIAHPIVPVGDPGLPNSLDFENA